jgi:hypothetical protein
MKPEEMSKGQYVCVAHGGCLHSPHITITSDGVWVKYGTQFTSAHRDCFAEWQRRENLEHFRNTAPEWNCVAFPGEGMHYVNPKGDCTWCGMTKDAIRKEKGTEVVR